MRFLVVGGAGFIGSHLVDHLLSKNPVAEVIVYDNYSSGPSRLLDQSLGSGKLRIIEGDAKDLSKLRSASTGVDVVFHLAANPDIAAAEKTPDIDFWAGTYLTQNVLEAMRQAGVSRLFYSSGSGVYGEAEIEFEESHGPCLPISTYGASKLASEAMIGAYCHMFGQRARVLRFANVVGARQTHGVGFDFLNRLAANPDELNVLGDGTQTKSYIHVNDVISAIDLMISQLMDDKAKPFDVFNVSTKDTVRVKEIAKLAAQLVSPAAKIRFGEGARGWKGDVPRVKFNSNKIGQLGWSPRMTSLEAVEASLSDMKSESQINRRFGK